jgi:hypothetical protein
MIKMKFGLKMSRVLKKSKAQTVPRLPVIAKSLINWLHSETVQ